MGWRYVGEMTATGGMKGGGMECGKGEIMGMEGGKDRGRGNNMLSVVVFPAPHLDAGSLVEPFV